MLTFPKKNELILLCRVHVSAKLYIHTLTLTNNRTLAKIHTWYVTVIRTTRFYTP